MQLYSLLVYPTSSIEYLTFFLTFSQIFLFGIPKMWLTRLSFRLMDIEGKMMDGEKNKNLDHEEKP